MKYARAKRWRVVVAGLGVATGVALTLAPPPAPFVTPPDPKRISAEQQLQTSAKDLTFVDVPLDEVMRKIAQRAGVRIRFDEVAPGEQDIDARGRMVTVNKRYMRCAYLLQAALAPTQTDSAALTYYIDDAGAMVVTTKKGDAKRAVTRTYDLSPLLEGVNRDVELKLLQDDIAVLLRETVAPESWIDVGPAGTITFQQSHIVVRQTPERLREVEQLLLQLLNARENGRLRLRLQGVKW